MSFAVITQRITGNESCTFDFSSANQPIGAFVYGLRQFSMVNPNRLDPQGALQDFGLSYTVASGTGVGHTNVVLVQQITAGLDPASTYADVTVLAFLGGVNPANLLLGNQKVAAGGMGTPLTPTYAPAVSCALLGGFSLSFASQACVLGIGAGAGMACVPGSTSVAPVGSGALVGEAAFSGTADVGYIVVGPSSPASIYGAVRGFTSPSSTFSAPFGAPLSACAVLIQSFYTQFWSEDPTPEMNTLAVSASGTASGNTVSGQVGVSYSGEYAAPYGGGDAKVTSTVGTLLVVGIV